MNSRGSVALESALSLILVLTIVTGLTQLSRLALARIWMSDVLYQYLICLEQNWPSHHCRTQAENQTAKFPLGTEGLQLRSENSRGRRSGSLSWDGFGQLHIRLTQSLTLEHRP